jgi:HTH-type transcriptional regulator/antitoxin HigA
MTKTRKVSDSYLELIHQFPLRPIHDEDEYDAATAVAEKLYLRDEKDLDVGERDYLDALDQFISAYDDQHYSIMDKRTPLQRLKALLVESKTAPSTLQKILGCSQPLVSMILAGKRELSKENIKALAGHFRVRADLFL